MGNEMKNVDTLKTAYKAWHDTKGASVDKWMGIIADDIKFGSQAAGAAHVAFTAEYTSKQALKVYFDGLLGGWTMIHYTVDDYIAQGDAVAVRTNIAWRNKQTGKVFETPKLDYWRFRDGKVVEFFEYYDTAAVQAGATP